MAADDTRRRAPAHPVGGGRARRSAGMAATRMRAMDSLTQILLGGAVAAAIAPAAHRRAALLAGAALGTLPDLDSLPILLVSDDPVVLMTVHRSFSHSLLVLPFVAWLVWWLFRRFGRGRVAERSEERRAAT